MIYTIVSLFVEVGVRQFFQSIKLSGAAVVSRGPVIIAANHPNQAVDSFMIGTIFKRPVLFLAKSSLFKNPLWGKFFRSLNMIPVYRAQDKSDTSLNAEMFREVVAKLLVGEAAAIFPEGTSSEERRLLPLKTGVARIALQAEVADGWLGRILIQPVGITYLSPRLFQSSVALVVGEPFSVADFRARYEVEPIATVKELTLEIERRLRLVTVSLPNLELQQDVERITQLFDDEPDMRERMQFIANKATEFAVTLPAETTLVRAEMERLSEAGYELGFFGIGSQTLVSQRISTTKLCLVLCGRVLHAAPYYATQMAIKFAVKDPHNLASVKIGFGLLFYSAWYLVLLLALLNLGVNGFIAVAILICVMVLGEKTNQYADGSAIFLRKFLSRVFSSKDSELAYHQLVDKFMADRAALKEKLILITNTYQNVVH